MIDHTKIGFILIFVVMFSGCVVPFGLSDDGDEIDRDRTPISEQTSTPTEIIATHTDSVSETESVTTTDSNSTARESISSEDTDSEESPRWDRRAKYDYFRDNFTDSIKLANVVNSSIQPGNQSMSITYIIDIDNLNKTNNKTTDVIYAYAAMVDLYIAEDKYDTLDESYVPKHLNVTAISSEGEIYYTGFVKFEWAYNWKIGDKWPGDSDERRQRYALEFFSTTDRGPAHPDYEEDPYDK